MSNEKIDGLDVDKFAGRFTGVFDMDENYRIDDEVVFMVVAKVTGAAHNTTPQGDLRRVNKFSVLEVALSTDMPTSRRIVDAANAIHDDLKVDDPLDPDEALDLDWMNDLDPGDLDPEESEEEDTPVDSRVHFGNPVQTPPISVPTGVPVVGRSELYQDGGWS